MLTSTAQGQMSFAGRVRSPADDSYSLLAPERSAESTEDGMNVLEMFAAAGDLATLGKFEAVNKGSAYQTRSINR